MGVGNGSMLRFLVVEMLPSKSILNFVFLFLFNIVLCKTFSFIVFLVIGLLYFLLVKRLGNMVSILSCLLLQSRS